MCKCGIVGEEDVERPQHVNFEHLLGAARQPIYDCVTFLLLRASIDIMNLQTTYGWSNASVDASPNLFGKMLPTPNYLPLTRVDAHEYSLLQQNPCLHQ